MFKAGDKVRFEHAEDETKVTNEKLYFVLDEDEWDLVDIHEAQDEANDMVKLGLRPLVVKVIAKTQTYLEPIKP